MIRVVFLSCWAITHGLALANAAEAQSIDAARSALRDLRSSVVSSVSEEQSIDAARFALRDLRSSVVSSVSEEQSIDEARSALRDLRSSVVSSVSEEQSIDEARSALRDLRSGVVSSVSEEQSIDAARSALRDGRFVQAAELGEALKTSEGYALAAESLAIYGHYLAEGEDKADLLSRAMRLAQEAIRSDSENPQAHLQSAHAMGRYTQAIGTLKVKRQYAKNVRAAIDQALLLDPEMAAAHLSLATWHAEAIKGGGFMAKVLYGASKKDALAHYEQAAQLAPEAKIGFAEYAFGLLLLDERRYRTQASDLLKRAIELPPKDAHDRIVHERTVAKLAELDPL